VAGVSKRKNTDDQRPQAPRRQVSLTESFFFSSFFALCVRASVVAQADEELEVRFALALRKVLKTGGEAGAGSAVGPAQSERWANKAGTMLAKEYRTLEAEAESAKAAAQKSLAAQDKKDERALVAARRNADDARASAENVLSAATSEAGDMDMDGPGSGAPQNPYGQKKNQPEPGCLMFNPTSPGRLSWDFMVILPCLAYLTVMMPFRMTFANEATGFLFFFEMTMDFVFIFDIWVNFRTGFADELSGFIVYDYHRVAMNYIKSW